MGMSSFCFNFDAFATPVPWLAAAMILAALPATAIADDPPLQAAVRPVPRQIAQANTIIIAGVDDITLGTWPGAGDLQGFSQHCVGTNAGGRRFGIVVTGSGAGGSFALSNGVSTLPFTVQYSDRRGTATVTPGVTLGNRRGQRLNQCRNIRRERMRISVRILSSDLSNATAGSYSGMLTLTVTPE